MPTACLKRAIWLKLKLALRKANSRYTTTCLIDCMILQDKYAQKTELKEGSGLQTLCT